MHRRTWLSAAALFALCAAQALPAGAVVTNLYEFSVTKNGQTFFHDTFDDGLAPPQSPSSIVYSVFGAFPEGSESGGRLRLDSAHGSLSFTNAGAQRLVQRVLLLSNADSADITSGLKRNHTFEVTALFDLVIPPEHPSSYDIRLIDRGSTGNLSDFVELQLIRTTAGEVLLRLRDENFITGVTTNVSSVPISSSDGDQVRLTLSHPADTDIVFASYEFFKAGVSQGQQTLPGFATIFSDENWTRAEFSALQALPVPEPETYAMMLAGLGLIGWQLRRKLKRAACLRIA